MAYLRNIVAVIRGNIKCTLWKIKHTYLIRFFSGVILTIEKSASVEMKRGVMIGRNASIIVRKNAFLSMGEMSSINADCKIVCQNYISIGNNTIFGPNVLLYDHDHIFNSNGVKRNDFSKGKIIIGDNCWIGAGTIILKDTIIGNNCVIGAGSVIKGKIPSGMICVQKRESIINAIK